MQKGKLYLIPTPINNSTLKEILLPQYIEIVSGLRYFVVETPKTARRHLGSLELKIPIQQIEMFELSEHTKNKDIPEMLSPVLAGNDMGVMSDAGVPSIADPGHRIVKEAQANGIEVVPFVGPSSILLALMASGLNGQLFAFNGYLPEDSYNLKREIRYLEMLAIKSDQTQIFMDTPYRNQKMLSAILDACIPTTLLCIALNVNGDSGFVKTKTIKEWKKEKLELPKLPCLFLINHQ